MLTVLEPRFEKGGTTLLNEMEETEELIFVSKGKIGIGYEFEKV